MHNLPLTDLDGVSGKYRKGMKAKTEKEHFTFNPIALRVAKTLWSFGCSECNRVTASNRKIADFANSPDPDDAADFFFSTLRTDAECSKKDQH